MKYEAKPMTFKVTHLLQAFSVTFLYSCAAADKISTDTVHSAVPL